MLLIAKRCAFATNHAPNDLSVYSCQLCSNIIYLMCGLSSLSFEDHCRLMPTLSAIGFSIIFAALLAKTYRIHRIFNSEGLKVSAPSSGYLVTVTGVVAGYDVLASVVWMASDAPVQIMLPTRTTLRFCLAFPPCVLAQC